MQIPNKYDLYMFVHWKKLRESNEELDLIKVNVPANIFVNKENKGMSTDWSKYSTPYQTQERAVSVNNLKNHYGVIGMNVGKVRKIEPLSIEYAPEAKNKAHTNIWGLPPTYNDKKKKPSPEERKLRLKIRKALSNISIWKIHYETDDLLLKILDPEISDPFN